MSSLNKKSWGYEYISNNGINYSVETSSEEFNVVIDHFMDILEACDCNLYIPPVFVDYVYGDIDIDYKDIKDWLDYYINIYEKHKRKVRFDNYECYLGLEEEQHDKYEVITKERLAEMMEEAKK